MGKVKLLLNVADNLHALADSIHEVADAMLQNDTAPAEAATVEEEIEEKPIKLEEVRAVLAEKSHDGKTDAVRNLLLKYGAPKLSAIDPKNYKALLADAEVL